jgi:hypothetical protein
MVTLLEGLLGAGIVSVLATQIATWWREWRARCILVPTAADRGGALFTELPRVEVLPAAR